MITEFLKYKDIKLGDILLERNMIYIYIEGIEYFCPMRNMIIHLSDIILNNCETLEKYYKLNPNRIVKIAEILQENAVYSNYTVKELIKIKPTNIDDDKVMIGMYCYTLLMNWFSRLPNLKLELDANKYNI